MAYIDDLVRAHAQIKQNWQKIPLKDGETIPDNILIPCPLQGQALVPAAQNCPTCPQFHGVGAVIHSSDPQEQADIDRSKPWERRHCICCITIMELKPVASR